MHLNHSHLALITIGPYLPLYILYIYIYMYNTQRPYDIMLSTMRVFGIRVSKSNFLHLVNAPKQAREYVMCATAHVYPGTPVFHHNILDNFNQSYVIQDGTYTLCGILPLKVAAKSHFSRNMGIYK